MYTTMAVSTVRHGHGFLFSWRGYLTGHRAAANVLTDPQSGQSTQLMTRLLSTILFLSVAAAPGLAMAQGSRGGFGGGRGRAQRGQGDTTATGAPRPQMSFAEIVFAHRSDLQLADSQTTKVSEIRMRALSRRVTLSSTLDSMKAIMAMNPSSVATPSTDSSRKEMAAQRHELASVLGDLHDVDVTARNETLRVLNPDQQKKAEQFEEQADEAVAPGNGAARGASGGGRRGGGRPGGGMGGMGNP
jgi:hypothetical protein